jgi:hypothetical protein
MASLCKTAAGAASALETIKRSREVIRMMRRPMGVKISFYPRYPVGRVSEFRDYGKSRPDTVSENYGGVAAVQRIADSV